MTPGSEGLPEVEPRARFYFDNYGRIEEWAALRKEAAAALHEQLVALAERVRAGAEERDDVVCWTRNLDEGGYPRVVLERPWWRAEGESGAPYGVAVEWERALITPSGQVRLYVAVRGNEEHPRFAGVQDAVRAAAAGWRRELPGSWSGGSAAWPCFAYVQPAGRIDEVELTARAAALQSEVLERLAPALDGLLAVARA